MGKIIGIDLGTTNSVAAIAAGVLPKVLDSREGRPQIRSVVSVKRRKGGRDGDGEFLVGDVAEDNWEMAPRDTIVSVKRLMGRGVADSEVQRIQQWALYKIVQPSDGTKDSVRVIIGGKEYSPIDVSAMILAKIKEDAEFRLGEPVTHAVVTVPAYFSQIQRDATRRAGLKAGLAIIKILDEPTAAAIAFGVESQESSEPKYLLVYDLGGGTFDISVLMWAGNVFAPLNLQGDMWLGGDNFDQVLLEHVVAHIRSEHGIDPVGNARFMVALRRKARAVKERLSSARSADFILPGMLQDREGDLIDVELEITREEFDRLVRPLVDRTVRLTEEALHNAGLTREQVHYVLMAGNATNIPLVQQVMEEMFGREKVLRKIHPKHCVALGAAIVATRIGERVVCQGPDPADPERECGHVNQAGATRCEKCGQPFQLEEELAVAGAADLIIGGIAQFHYGTQTAGDKFNVFIRKNDPYPTENPESQTFYTSMPNQRMISIPVYGGDHLEQASRNEKQGEAFAILPPGLPRDTAVRIKLWLNGDGIFDLTAHLEDGTDLRPWVMQGGADQKAVEAIQEVEQRLHEKAQALSPAELLAMEQARAEAFDRLRRGDHSGARERAEHFKQVAEEAGGSGERDQLVNQAEGLIGFTQFLVSEYSWALGPERSYRLNQLADEAREALGSGNRRALEQKLGELDRATDDLPESVQVLLGLRGAINSRIRPVDPGRAGHLLGELEQIEAALKAGDPAAMSRLAGFAAEVAKAIMEADRARPSGARCARCGAELRGSRHCPKCGTDSWVLQDKASTGSTGSTIISH